MLENEIALFEEKLPDLLKDREGQFVLIKGTKLHFFQSEIDTIHQGLEKYGAKGQFLVRRIVAKPPKVSIPAFSMGLISAHI